MHTTKLAQMPNDLPLGLGERLPRKGEFAARDKREAEQAEREREMLLFEAIDNTFDHPLAHSESAAIAGFDWASDELACDYAKPYPPPPWWNADCRFALPFDVTMGVIGLQRYAISRVAEASWQTAKDISIGNISRLIQLESMRLQRLMPELQGVDLWRLFMNETWKCDPTWDPRVPRGGSKSGNLKERSQCWTNFFQTWAEWKWQSHCHEAVVWHEARKERKSYERTL